MQIWPSNNFLFGGGQVKISHYVHFQGHILILGEVTGNQILGKT